MRRALGLILLATISGCAGSRGACSSCGPGCGPALCCEHHCYCRTLDDAHTAFAARRCAYKSLPHSGSCDFRRGFTQAFVDVALGRTGEAPPVPPQRYWSVCFRSDCGDGRAADWYDGYRAGVAAAGGGCGGAGRVHVPSSGTGYHRGPVHGMQGSDDWGANSHEWGSLPGCACGS